MKSNARVHMGHLGIGKAGDWQIDLDQIEPQSSADKPGWGLTIDNCSFCLQLQIDRVSILKEMSRFLDNRELKDVDVLRIGSWHDAEVMLTRAESRVQLRLLRQPVGMEFPALVELNLTGDDILAFYGALEDLLRTVANHIFES